VVTKRRRCKQESLECGFIESPLKFSPLTENINLCRGLIGTMRYTE